MNEATDPIQAAAESLLIMPEAPESTEVEEPQVDEGDLEPAEEAELESSENDESEEAPEENAEKEEAPQVFTVKVDGKETEVTLDDLKRSYSGQAYIQKGMQEAATIRKEADAAAQALLAEQERFVERVNQIQQQGVMLPPTPPNDSMLNTDPIGYMQAKAAYDRQAAAYQAQQSEIQHIQQQNAALQEQRQKEFVEEQRKLLAAKVPELFDGEKGKSIQEKIRKYGVEDYGLTNEELAGIADARYVEVLYDAIKWRDLQKSKAQPIKAASSKTVKPQASRPQPQQLVRAKQVDAAIKSGDLRQIAAAALLVRK